MRTETGGYPQGGSPYGAPQMGGMPGMGAPQMGGNRYGAAQSALKDASTTIKYLQIGMGVGGAVLAVIGVISLVTASGGMGIPLMITGGVLVGTAVFMLPQFVRMMGSSTAMVDALHAKDQLVMTGMPMMARVISVQQTGVMINMNPQVRAQLEIQGPQGPYQVQSLAVIPQMNIPQFQPGAMVNVRVNPGNPHDVAVAM
ncbi:MAG: hypothetical protein EXR75_00805 [Myxococcales bacterium]|nr:hypothetical protein [Myxococcales bacterium]